MHRNSTLRLVSLLCTVPMKQGLTLETSSTSLDSSSPGSIAPLFLLFDDFKRAHGLDVGLLGGVGIGMCLRDSGGVSR